MEKPFTTLDEQINLLTDRGVTVNNIEDAKKKLLKASYYRVINGYAKYIQSSNVFIDGATFEDIFQIYVFDKKIKNVFFQYILKTECILKSYITYIFSKNHKEKYSYLQPNNFSDEDIFATSELNLKLARVIKNKSKNRNGNIYHYITHHDYVPFWVLVNHLDFGTIENFYKLMLPQEKNEVAKLFSDYFFSNYNRRIFITPEEIESFVFLIREARNVVAHDERLMGFKCRKHAKYLTVVHNDVFGINSNSARNNVFNLYMIMHIFLDNGEYYRLTNILDKTISKAGKQIKCIDVKKLLDTYGIPEGYDFMKMFNRKIKEHCTKNK